MTLSTLFYVGGFSAIVLVLPSLLATMALLDRRRSGDQGERKADFKSLAEPRRSF